MKRQLPIPPPPKRRVPDAETALEMAREAIRKAKASSRRTPPRPP